MPYRRDIDGLRSIAVLPVILFHAGFSLFQGGFVGVDVFFVISGFLITSIIANELDAGQFSIVKFYERRARRILPALFLVLACCLPCAWLWLQPQDMKNFAQSMVAVAAFASNIFFLRASGYFDSATELKPLLHTWSLAVEEQYYVFFPLLLMLCWRWGRKWVVGAVVAVAVLSFWVAHRYLSSDPAFAFYGLPTRAWELMIGALVALLNPGRWAWARQQGLTSFISWAGLGLIVVPVFLYNAHTPFPGPFALAPTLGAALLLALDTSATPVGRCLSSRPMVTVGLISYSAYLWHQPMFAFARHWSLTKPSPWLMSMLTAMTLVLAYISWRWIEAPFRNRQLVSNRALVAFACSGSLMVLGLGMLGHKTQGLPQRYAADQSAFLQYFANDIPAMPYFERTRMFQAYHTECDYYDMDKYRQGKSTRIPRANYPQACFQRDARLPHAVLIWGDSHAQQLVPGLHAHLPADWQILQVTSSGCAPQLHAQPSQRDYCAQSNWLAFQTVQQARPDVVVIGRNVGHDAADLRAMAEVLLQAGARQVVVAGPSPHWVKDLPQIVAFRLWPQVPLYTQVGLDDRAVTADRILRAAFQNARAVRYVSLMDSLCNDRGCRVYFGQDIARGISSWDYGHLTPIASEKVARDVLVPAILR